MNAIVIQQRGNPVAPNVKYIEDAPKPAPGLGEVLVRTEASALNSLDIWIGRGVPGIDTIYPFSSGSDGVGRVVEVGVGVESAWIGRRVLLNAAVVQNTTPHPDRVSVGEDIRMIGEHTAGTMREFFVAPATNVLDIGDIDPVKACAFGLTHLTAWRMLMTRARFQPGMILLVTGIGGGVALALLNIAKHFGCEVIVTSRHQSKLDRAMKLGANHGILDDGSDWSKAVRAITGKRGVDIVADSVGRAVHMSCIKSLARGGVLVTCGATTGGDANTDLSRVFWNQLTIVGSTMGDMTEFRAVSVLLKSGSIEPVIDSVHRPHNASLAFEKLESATQFGKIVIDWR
ncbi:MAG: NADPH:quinone reductase [Phycisphaerales bacterium]|nr:NADPH:quinone reductase [Phycisphaerales bacterium]